MERYSHFPQDFSWKQDTDHWLPTDLRYVYHTLDSQLFQGNNLVPLMFLPQNK